MFNSKIISVLTLATALLFSCRKETKITPNKPKDEGAGETETITRVEIRAINGTNTVLGSWIDFDGVGGNSPTIVGLNLTKSAMYNCNISVYDDTKNPISLVSSEILKEADAHRFHFTSNPSTILGIVITDVDSKNQPLGLQFLANTPSSSVSGSLNINLRHFGEGETKTANITDGESDMDINLPIIVN